MVHWYHRVVRVSGLGLNSAITAALKFGAGKSRLLGSFNKEHKVMKISAIRMGAKRSAIERPWPVA
jgi:hypothetical protein